MTADETKELLRYIAAIDGRKVTADTVRAWHDILKPFAAHLVWKSTRTAIKNAAGKYLEISHIVDVIRSEQRASGFRTCEHGSPIGAHCHDCTHPPDCAACMPIPGLSDTEENRRAAVRAMSRRIERRSA